MLVTVIKAIEPETGIEIKVGAVGMLEVNGPQGWPLFKTIETGTEWDLAIPQNELEEYFSLM